jgi:hypothetical protein
MPREAINVFDLDNYSAGGYFVDGLYRIESSRFGYFDFQKANNDALCLIQQLQPLDGGKDKGDIKVQYWPVMDKDKEGNRTVEPMSPVKGEKGAWSQIRLTEANKHDKLFGGSAFMKYMSALQKAGFDMDSAGNDITSLDSLVAEFGKLVEKARETTVIEEAEGGGPKKKKKETYETIIITNIPSTAPTPIKKDNEEKPKPGKKSKSLSPEELVQEYLDAEVCKESNKEDEVAFLSHRLQLSNWLVKEKDCDADTTKAAMGVYNDDKKLSVVLKTFTTDDGSWVKEGKFFVWKTA